MTSEAYVPSTTFEDKMVNSIKRFHGKSSSSGTTVNQSIKFLRWWCNCKPSSNSIPLPQESTVTEKNRIDETLEAVKHIVENISETLHDAIEAPVLDENTQTLLSTLIKSGVILLFIGCILYLLSGIKRKIANYRTNPGDSNTKMTSLVISKSQEGESGDLFFKQQKLQNNSLTVLTPIVSQKTAPFTPVNSKEKGRRSPNSSERLLRKAASPTQKNEMLIVAPICTSPGNKTDDTQRDDATSPGRTDRTQSATSPVRTDPTQRDASSPPRTDPTQQDSLLRTDATQKTSSPTSNNGKNGNSFSNFQAAESRHSKT